MKTVIHTLVAGMIVLLPLPSLADQQTVSFGGDVYTSGQSTNVAAPVTHDAFAAGSTVQLSAPVAADAHLAGFDVQSNSDVAGNLYAAGFTVSVAGTVKGDVTVMGNSVVLHTSAPLPGNVRAAAANFTLDSETDGAVLVTAETATINAPIMGDLSFYGRNLVFGPNATVSGQVLVHAPQTIVVPASVASADRVIFTQLTSPEYPTQMGQTAEIVAKGFWATLWAAVIWWLLLLAAGVAFITLGPRMVSNLEVLSTSRPVRRLGLGLLGFAAVLGLVFVSALTIVGLLLVPFVLIFVVVACSLAYVAGAYLIGRAIGTRFMPLDTALRRVIVLAISLVAAGLVVAVPFLGWLISLLIVVYGFGVITALIMTRWSIDDRKRLGEPGPTPAVGTPSVA